jgi:hypothetical protein
MPQAASAASRRWPGPLGDAIYEQIDDGVLGKIALADFPRISDSISLMPAGVHCDRLRPGNDRADVGCRGSSVRSRSVFRDRCASAAWRIGCGNLAAKAPSDLRSEFKTRVSACYQVPSWAIARCLATESAPTAPASCRARSPVEDDFQVCIAHLRLPVTCRCFIRTTNIT